MHRTQIYLEAKTKIRVSFAAAAAASARLPLLLGCCLRFGICMKTAAVTALLLLSSSQLAAFVAAAALKMEEVDSGV